MLVHDGEPFGRSSLEASRGCAAIISNKGGLPETITDGIILNKLTVNNIYKNIKNLIIDKKNLEISKKSYKILLDNKFISEKIDNYRNSFYFNLKNKK